MHRILFAVLALALAMPGAPSRPPETNLGRYGLAFVRYDSRGPNIWLARGDGTHKRLLIKQAECPSWSPDGKKIAFVRSTWYELGKRLLEPRGLDIWWADADGTHQRRLTWRWKNVSHEFAPEPISISWCPFAPRLTFSNIEHFKVTHEDSGYSEVITGCSIFDIFTNQPSRGIQRIYFDLYDRHANYNFAWNSNPAWSPHGKYFAFARDGDVWAVRASRDEFYSSSNRPNKPSVWAWTPTRIAAPAQFDAATDRGSKENYGVTHLDWSPDETHLAYCVRRLGGSGFWEIHILDIVGRGAPEKLHVLRDRKVGGGLEPAFTPDGAHITFCRQTPEDNDEWGIWASDVDGQHQHRLLKDGMQPAWRPRTRVR